MTTPPVEHFVTVQSLGRLTEYLRSNSVRDGRCQPEYRRNRQSSYITFLILLHGLKLAMNSAANVGFEGSLHSDKLYYVAKDFNCKSPAKSAAMLNILCRVASLLTELSQETCSLFDEL
jgi:hypothetical protein